MEHINEGKQYGVKASMLGHGKQFSVLDFLNGDAHRTMRNKLLKYESCEITLKAYNTYNDKDEPITEGYFKIEVNPLADKR